MPLIAVPLVMGICSFFVLDMFDFLCFHWGAAGACGSGTVETREAMGRRAMANVEAFLAGREPPDRIA